MSRMMAGVGDALMGDQEAEGSEGQPTLSTEDRLQQAYTQIVQMHAQQDQLSQELAALRAGGPNQGRPGWPLYRPDPDRFSLP